jgi:hypothetical protein
MKTAHFTAGIAKGTRSGVLKKAVLIFVFEKAWAAWGIREKN